ncbi:hypothetical protein [Paenibacillus nasutitermitis]|uniref:hypothetical protein n=1 Tax=Paenibacillus nasutitermitis TaxID=1652958 RepID=UPI00166DCBE3|nr:hypothetical protein [Paenibacillus nasutitermitis]
MLRILNKINLWALWFALLCWALFLALFNRDFFLLIRDGMRIEPFYLLFWFSGASIAAGSFGISGIQGVGSLLRAIGTMVLSVPLFLFTALVVFIGDLMRNV